MKKNEARQLKRLRLSRETLHALTSSDARKVAGAASLGISCPTGNVGCFAELGGGGGVCPETGPPTENC